MIVSEPINTMMITVMISSSTIFSFHVWNGRFKEIDREEERELIQARIIAGEVFVVCFVLSLCVRENETHHNKELGK